MQLLSLNDQGEVELNKLWLKTNPILWRLYERDNERKALDTQARVREKAHREYKFLWKLFDPDSEYKDFSEFERFKRSAKLFNIPYLISQRVLPKATAKDPDRFEDVIEIKDDQELQDAVDEYRDIINSLITVQVYNAAKVSMSRKIEFLTTFDFKAVDKQGKLLLTPDTHTKAISALPKDMANVAEFGKSMRDEMISEAGRTRQTLKLGLNEGRKKEFSEGNGLSKSKSIDVL